MFYYHIKRRKREWTQGRLTYDPAVALDTLIFGEFLNGYMIELNETEPGQILFAASGNQPNTETGTIANLTFEVLEGFYGESSVTLSDLRVNENEELEVGAEMTVIMCSASPEQVFLKCLLCIRIIQTHLILLPGLIMIYRMIRSRLRFMT